MEPKRVPLRHPEVSARGTEEGERFNRVLFSALDAIEEEKIPYALIGGVAASGLGRPRSTHDIDIFVQPEYSKAVLDALERRGFKTEKTDATWLYKAWKEEVLVDVIFKSTGDIYFDEQMRARSQPVPYHGREVRAVSPEDLIIIKSAVANENGPHHWHDALAVLSHSKIDWDYLLERTQRAGRRVLSLLIYAQSNDILVPNWTIMKLFDSIFSSSETATGPTITAAAAAAATFTNKRPWKPQPISPVTLQQPFTTSSDALDGVRRAREALDALGETAVSVLQENHSILLKGEVASEDRKRKIDDLVARHLTDLNVHNRVRTVEVAGPESEEVVS